MIPKPADTLFDLYSEGLKFVAAGKINEAEAAFYGVLARYFEADGKVLPEDRGIVAESFFQAGTIAKTMGDIAPAAALLGHALALGCERPEAATGLAFALLHCNRLEAAEKALEKMPGGPAASAEAAWLRGQIELKRKSFPAAETWLREAVSKGAGRGEIYIDLAFALEGQGKFREGFDALAHALKANPSLHDVFLEAGDRAFALDQEGLGLWWLRRTEKVSPPSPAAWYYLGARYYALGARDEAERAYLASLNLGQNLNAYQDLSRLLEQSNRLKQAANVARAGLRLDPGHSGLRNTLARCQNRQGAKEAALGMFMRIAETGDVVDAKAAALLSAGKILDELGRFGEAFGAFTKGKELRRALPEFGEFNIEVAHQHLEESKAIAGDRRPPAAVRRDPDEPEQTVFFVAFPRSGTTLLQEVMQAHPAIAVAEEKSIVPALRIMLHKLGPNIREALSNLTPAKAGLLRKLYFLQASALKPWDGKKVFVDKMPLNLAFLPVIRALFPDAKILLGLRHPCSAVLSCLMQDFQLNNAMIHMMTLDSITRYYEGVMSLWLEVAADPAFAPLIVKYEDVVKDLEVQARRVTDFFGLPFSPEMLTYAEKAKAKGMIRTPSYSQVVKPIYAEAVDRWKNYRAQIEPFLDRLRPYIKAFGYSE